MNNHLSLVRTYLSGSFLLLKKTKLNNPGVKPACRIYLIGIVDMIRQVNQLEWAEFLEIIEQVFIDCQLMPKSDMEEYINFVGENASKHEFIGKILQEGAQSIKSYVSENNKEAPNDLLRIAIYAEKNQQQINEIFGNE